MAAPKPIDPTQDVAGILGAECFMCGKPIHDGQQWANFGPRTSEDPKLEMAPQLPLHLACINDVQHEAVMNEYHNRIADLAGVKRIGRH